MGLPEARQSTSLAQRLALPEGHYFEFVRGTLIEKAAPTFEHGLAQSGVGRTVGSRFRRAHLACALVLTAKRGQRVQPEPFEAEAFAVNELLGEAG